MITREPEFWVEPDNFFARLGHSGIKFCQGVGRSVLITAQAAWASRFMFSKRCRGEVAYQLFVTGIKSLPVLTVVALFTGMIFALQIGLELRDYGQEVNIGGGVAVTMFREMGPFMTALIIAASVGSSIAAQLGTMTVSEEIAALEIMSINPVRFLVMPRLIALAVMMPILSFYTDLLAIMGGALVGKTQIGVDYQAYFDNMLVYAEIKDLYVGLLKAFVFGVIICTVACYQGLTTTDGAVGVGRATRQSVVISFLVILVSGYIVTKFFYQ